jgi:hypothetical protein
MVILMTSTLPITYVSFAEGAKRSLSAARETAALVR